MRRTFTLAAGLALWAAAAWALPQPLVDLDLMPDYQLPGNAAFPAPEPAAPPVIEMPPSEAPAFMGLEPTETRAVDVRASDFAYSGVTIEMWLLDHVNQPVGAVLSAAEPGEEPSWLLGYSEEQAVLSADGRLLESGAQEAWKGRWYHVAATYDGYSARLYVNGELAASQPLMDADPPAGRARITLTGYFGHEPRMELGNLLYGFRMYAQPLTADEVAGLFAERAELADAGRLDDEEFHFTAGPLLQSAEQDAMTILWETDRASTGVVAYGDRLPLAKRMESASKGRLHEVTLEGLEPGAPYFYRVTAEADGATLSSPALTFQTAVPEERPFAFAVMGDTESRPHVNNAIAQAIWGQRPNFVINVGDLTDGGQEPRRFEWTHEYFPGVGHLAARVPFFSLPGNGDSDLVWYKRYHSLPGQENYYAFSYGNADFFILDSNRSFAPGSEQYEWLARVLPASDATWKFAAHHHPAYSSDENDYGDTWSGPSNYGDDNVRHLLPLYEENGVDMVFFGHLHTYERSWPIAGGGPVTEGGVIHVQTGGAGGHLEDAAPNRTPFMHTVYRGRHYCMLRIYGGRLEFEMIDMDGRLRDRLVIEK